MVVVIVVVVAGGVPSTRISESRCFTKDVVVALSMLMAVLVECFIMDITASDNNVPVDTVVRLQVLPVKAQVVDTVAADAARFVSVRWQSLNASSIRVIAGDGCCCWDVSVDEVVTVGIRYSPISFVLM